MGWLDHDRLGFNYRLTDLQAALGVAQLERLDELLERRARVAALYERAASPASRACGCRGPGARRGERRSWFVYVVRLPEGADRDAGDRPPRRAGIARRRPTCPAST